MAVSNKELINQATERANAPRKSGKPVFLFLAEGQKALIRPMFDIDSAITLQYHNKWSENAEYRVNAVCASELGKPCTHCESAKELEDKKLKASPVIYLPVYVYQVIDVRSSARITYTEKDEAGNQTEKPISGFRVLELALYGKTLMILQAFTSYERDEDDHDIRVCDFSIEQTSKGQSKNFLVTPKAPKLINPKIQDDCPDITKFHEAILAARPPLVANGESAPARGAEQGNSTSEGIEVDEDNIAVF
jgi:hypothetical protein